jgi:hypothetical protein
MSPIPDAGYRALVSILETELAVVAEGFQQLTAGQWQPPTELSRLCRTNSSTANAGRPESSCPTRSSSTSRSSTTGAAGAPSSATFHPSNTSARSPTNPLDSTGRVGTKLAADPALNVMEGLGGHVGATRNTSATGSTPTAGSSHVPAGSNGHPADLPRLDFDATPRTNWEDNATLGPRPRSGSTPSVSLT